MNNGLRAVGPTVLVVLAAGFSWAQERPEGFKQIIPRGRIAAVTNPEYVPASEAKIKDRSWVLGAVIEGQARAFSLNLLNSHEVVNDTIGDTDFAAVW